MHLQSNYSCGFVQVPVSPGTGLLPPQVSSSARPLSSLAALAWSEGADDASFDLVRLALPISVSRVVMSTTQ